MSSSSLPTRAKWRMMTPWRRRWQGCQASLLHGWLPWKGKATNLGLRQHGEENGRELCGTDSTREWGRAGEREIRGHKGLFQCGGRGKRCHWLITAAAHLTRGHPSMFPPPGSRKRDNLEPCWFWIVQELQGQCVWHWSKDSLKGGARTVPRHCRD